MNKLPIRLDLSDQITDPRLKELYKLIKDQPNVYQFNGDLTIFVNGNLSFISEKIHWNPEVDEFGIPIEKELKKEDVKSKCESCKKIRRIWNRIVRKLMLPV